MVKVGITSVKGKISSKNAIIVPLEPPKRILNKMAEMGAHTISINSPIPVITYDSIPIKSNSMHSHNGGSLIFVVEFFINISWIRVDLLPRGAEPLQNHVRAFGDEGEWA